jgi:hypothetical protein
MNTTFWCIEPGCNRNRPFPRKDKLASHVKAMHKAAVPSPTSLNLLPGGILGASGFLNPNGITFGDLPTASERINFGGVNSPAGASWSADMNGQIDWDDFGNIGGPISVDRPAGNPGRSSINVDWFSNNPSAGLDLLSDIGLGEPTHFNEHSTVNGFAGSNMLFGGDGFTGAEGLNTMAGVGGIDWRTSINEPANYNELPAINDAASAPEGTGELTGGFGALEFVSRGVENLSYVGGDMTNVGGLYGGHTFADTNDFGSMGGLAGTGGVFSVDGLIDMEDMEMEGHGSMFRYSNGSAAGDV